MAEQKWYVVQTHSNKEFAAKEALEKRIKHAKLETISDIIVPTYKETVYKDGKKKQVVKKSFPGYIYVKMEYDPETEAFTRESPYITRFVIQEDPDAKRNPAQPKLPRPLSDREVKALIAKTEAAADTAPVQIDFDVGQKVLIIDGPFNNFNGTIKAIYPDKRKVAVNVEIFGRTTPVEIDYFKVKKF